MNRYICPMHPSLFAGEGSRCPRCGMTLVKSDSRYPRLQHLFGDPVHVALMALVMLAFTAAAMMLVR